MSLPVGRPGALERPRDPSRRRGIASSSTAVRVVTRLEDPPLGPDAHQRAARVFAQERCELERDLTTLTASSHSLERQPVLGDVGHEPVAERGRVGVVFVDRILPCTHGAEEDVVTGDGFAEGIRQDVLDPPRQIRHLVTEQHDLLDRPTLERGRGGRRYEESVSERARAVAPGEIEHAEALPGVVAARPGRLDLRAFAERVGHDQVGHRDRARPRGPRRE